MKRLTTVLLFALAPTTALALPAFPNQIPNGGTNSCATCHINPAGGGATNDFGTDVDANIVGGVVQWNELFNIDSDGDGQTNGQELQDPCGTWSQGDADPAGDVSAPGDDSDVLGAPPDNTCEGVEPAPPPEGGCSSTGTTTGFPAAIFALLGFALIRRRK